MFTKHSTSGLSERVRRTRPWLAAAGTAGSLMISGCSITGLGAGSSLTCKLPEGARCDSVSNTYNESTRGQLPGQARRRAMEGGDAEPAPSGTSQRGADAGASYVDARLSPAAMPLRSQPRIARVWIKPWEDSDGDLHDQSYVYLPVDEGHWMLEHKQREVRKGFTPLRAGTVPRETSAALPAVPGVVGTMGMAGATAAAGNAGNSNDKLAETMRRLNARAGNPTSNATAGTSNKPQGDGRGR